MNILNNKKIYRLISCVVFMAVFFISVTPIGDVDRIFAYKGLQSVLVKELISGPPINDGQGQARGRLKGAFRQTTQITAISPPVNK